jgi:large subunit ribosomal protein L34
LDQSAVAIQKDCRAQVQWRPIKAKAWAEFKLQNPGGCGPAHYTVDTVGSAGMFTEPESRRRGGEGWLLPVVIWQRQSTDEMKRQYQPSKIRRKRQHGFLNRKSSKSGRAILRNRRRVGRERLTPV